jgi:hypothetical protein
MDSWFSELRSGTAPSFSVSSSMGLSTPIQGNRRKKNYDSEERSGGWAQDDSSNGMGYRGYDAGSIHNNSSPDGSPSGPVGKSGSFADRAKAMEKIVASQREREGERERAHRSSREEREPGSSSKEAKKKKKKDREETKRHSNPNRDDSAPTSIRLSKEHSLSSKKSRQPRPNTSGELSDLNRVLRQSNAAALSQSHDTSINIEDDDNDDNFDLNGDFHKVDSYANNKEYADSGRKDYGSSKEYSSAHNSNPPSPSRVSGKAAKPAKPDRNVSDRNASISPTLWEYTRGSPIRGDQVGQPALPTETRLSPPMTNMHTHTAAMTTLSIADSDEPSSAGYYSAKPRRSSPTAFVSSKSPLVRSASGAAILGVRTGGRNNYTDAFEKSYPDDTDYDQTLLTMPRETITAGFSRDNGRPMSAQGSSRVSSASVIRPTPFRQDLKKRRNKSASLSRRLKEEQSRRHGGDGPDSPHRKGSDPGSYAPFEIGADRVEDDEIMRPPSRQAHAFPMSLGDKVNMSISKLKVDAAKDADQHSDTEHKIDGMRSPSKSVLSGSNLSSAHDDDEVEQEERATLVAEAARESKHIVEKRQRPSSRKKHPAKAMFLSDDLDSVERVVVGSPDTKRISTGWDDPVAVTGGAAAGGIATHAKSNSNEGLMKAASQKGNVMSGMMRDEARASPSMLSLGDPDDEVEFVVGPSSMGSTMSTTRGQKKVDERRDNPDRDGFAELAESGLYEIKIELNNDKDLDTPRTKGERDEMGVIVKGGEDLNHSGINININGLGGSPIRSTGNGGNGGNGNGNNNNNSSNSSASSSNNNMMMNSSSVNNDMVVHGAVPPPNPREKGAPGDPTRPDMGMGARGARTIRTAPSKGGFMTSKAAIPMPPDAVRPDTVANTNAGSLIIAGDSDSDSDGYGDAVFTPVNKGGLQGGGQQTHGWSDPNSDDDLLLTSFHGDELDDLNDDWPELEEFNTNLGTDFLSLFAPSPPPPK